jgi:hypothetical protein
MKGCPPYCVVLSCLSGYHTGKLAHKSLLTNRLHGTYLPRTLTQHQRLIPELPEQVLLQDKLVLSRIRHFVSIIFSRPSSREKSRFEKAVLAVMWPMAVCMLCLAFSEGLRALSMGRGMTRDSSIDQNATHAGGVANGASSPKPIWPQVSLDHAVGADIIGFEWSIGNQCSSI